MTLDYIQYARRSSTEKKRQIQSIPDQIKWADQLARDCNYNLIATFTDSQTATKPGRQGFNQMMNLIHNREEPVGIITWKMDRLARNPVDEGMIKYAFMQGKIKHIVSRDRVFHEGENQILMGVEFGAATQYSIELSRNVKRGMKSKVEKGWKPGIVPLGYLNDPHGYKGEKKIYSDGERFELIQKMWRLLLTGLHSVPKITRIANEEWGVRDRKGRKLSRSTVYDMFNNPFYAGLFRWQGALHEGKHKKMVSLAEFDQAQLTLGNKRPRYRKHEHTYAGLIRCGECGCMITAEPPKCKKGKSGEIFTYHYLRCSKKKGPCSQRYIRLEKLEAQINRLLTSIEISPEFETWAFLQLRKANRQETALFKAQRRKLSIQIEENDHMIEKLIDKLLQGVIDDLMFKESKTRYQTSHSRFETTMKPGAKSSTLDW